MMNTVSLKWLLARLYEPDLVIVDSRFWLNDPSAGYRTYQENHIPRAIYLDLDKDLSTPVQAHGGRHPLPDVETMSRTFGKAGISRASRVIIYDDNQGMNASRVWWMLSYLGHERVAILEQGFTAWQAASFPVTPEQPVVVPAAFEASAQPDWLVDVAQVRQVSAALSGAASGSAGTAAARAVLIDSREPRRYQGLEEPIDAKAGHIPGAVNYFWKDVLREDGSFKSAEELQAHFAGLDKEAELIVYCGSGVTACPNVFALKQAGFEKVKLYGGSWSDWISYQDNPVATGGK